MVDERRESKPPRKGTWRAATLSAIMPAGREKSTEARA